MAQRFAKSPMPLRAMVVVASVAAFGVPANAATPVRTSATPLRAPVFAHKLGKLTVASTTFADGGTMPVSAEFGPCGGGNVSPQVRWSGAPAGTRSYFVTLFDPDAPTGVGFWHWTIFDIPPTVTSLAADAAAHPPAGAVQGYVDYGMSGYGGPCPPPGDGPHRYRLTVYALGVARLPDATAAATGATLMFMAQATALAVGSYTGTFAK